MTAVNNTYGLLGPREIAEYLSVERKTVDTWRTRGVLPDPSLELSGHPMWDIWLIQEWAASTGRLPMSERA